MAVPADRAVKYDEALAALAAGATYLTTFEPTDSVDVVPDECRMYCQERGVSPTLGVSVEQGGWWVLRVAPSA